MEQTFEIQKKYLKYRMNIQHIRGVPKTGIDKTFIRSCSRPQFTVFEFISIQYICKFCLVYHLKDFDASR